MRALSFFLAILLISTLSFGYLASAVGARTYRSVPEAGKRIALTFDDGPHPAYTRQILERLRRYGIKATFFVIGQNIEYYDDGILREMIDDGHELGNHTYTHRHTKNISREELMQDVRRCHTIVKERYGYEMRLFRPPEGYTDQGVMDISAQLGYSVILWSIDTKDWEHTGSSLIVSNVRKSVSSGDIILMHDYVSKPNTTISALDDMIPELLARGYTFVTVSELIKSS